MISSLNPHLLQEFLYSEVPIQYYKSELSTRTIAIIDCMLLNDVCNTDDEDISETLNIKLRYLKKDIPAAKLKNVSAEINKIDRIRQADKSKNQNEVSLFSCSQKNDSCI